MVSKKALCCYMVCLLLFLTGCTGEGTVKEKIRDLEFTVVKEEEIPEELKVQIEQKKESRFKLTYKTDEYLYIASGYGAQETGGYSISIKELYLTENAIYLKTELSGPQKGENVSKGMSYPYIAVKLERRDEPVVFE